MLFEFQVVQHLSPVGKWFDYNDIKIVPQHECASSCPVISLPRSRDICNKRTRVNGAVVQ